MESNFILPAELIYRILCFLGPRDIIQLRTVSKQFNAIACDPTIWRSLYTSARLPRYPGPFPTQSTEFLERTLIHSESLAKSWTTQPMRCVSRVEIRELGLSSPFPQIINGRWVIGCKSSRLFVVHDIDSGSSRVIWKKHSGRPIYSWSAISASTDEGLIVYLVFNDVTLTSPWKLLEFRVDGDSSQLYHSLTLDVPTRTPEEIVCLDGKQTPFLHIVTQQLIFDARTKRFCEFPEFYSMMFQAPVNWNFIRTLLTKTHIIRIRRVFDPAVSPPVPLTLIQAFTSPSDSRSVGGGVGTATLRLSHEGIMYDASESYRTIRDSITDHAGRTTVRLLRQSVEDNVMHFSCIELALPNQLHTDTVHPIVVNSHDVAQLDCRPFKHRQHMTYIESSDDGHVRGFVRFSELNQRVRPISADLVVKFTIDASGERCIVTLGPVMKTQIDKPFPFAHIWFDNVRGRLCFAEGGVVPRMHAPRDVHRAVVVMDIK